jgi:hypothetical protein
MESARDVFSSASYVIPVIDKASLKSFDFRDAFIYYYHPAMRGYIKSPSLSILTLLYLLPA